MSFYLTRDSIHPLTWPAIQHDGNTFHGDDLGYDCGCRPHPTEPHRRFHLCEYHDGYDDACHRFRPNEVTT